MRRSLSSLLVAVPLLTGIAPVTAREHATRTPAASSAAREPAYASDGRLAVSVRGDLWVRELDGRWRQATNGSSWDREPTWTADGTHIVFASNRSGPFAIWRVRADGDNQDVAAERLTASDAHEAEPTVLPDGRILFARGSGPGARIWVRNVDGTETRFTNASSAERWPAASPDGRRVAWVSMTETGRQLRVRTLSDQRDATALNDSRVERPAWSPAGDRLTVALTGPRAGVYVIPADGRYMNLVSERAAASAWAPDGRTLALAELPPADVGYNGDPDRVPDRSASRFAPGGGLWFVDAPAPPDAGSVVQAGDAFNGDRSAQNAAAFDEVWERAARLYYSSGDSRRAGWERLRVLHRPRAIAARDDEELRSALHALLRERPPLAPPATGRAAVSSAHPVATEAGLEILRRGGNVVDAAVAVSFALGVVEPDASGIGGYGQMLIHMNGMERPRLIEFMSRAPEDAPLSNTDFLQDGRLPPDGPVLAIVPGTVAGMHTAWRDHGSGAVTWADLLGPAIRAAQNGYEVSDGLATTLSREREHFLKYAGSRALFFRDGRPLAAGDTVKNPDLVWTLEQIAQGGAAAFYEGEIARRAVADLRAGGNPIKMSDFARYHAADREPVSTTYRGHTIYSSAPPVSGGSTISAKLNMLELFRQPRRYTDDAATLHAMLAAWQLVPSGRGRIADPGLWPTNTTPFTSKDTAQVRWRCFTPDRALTVDDLRGEVPACMRDSEPARAATGHSTGTTAFTVADADGNMVSVTQTLGTWGGNFHVTPGLGFLYNDKMGSYPSDPAAYGARLPFARHGSTIAPTLVFEGTGARQRPMAAVGAAGNAWILSAVYQSIVGMIDFKLDPQAALEQPRFLVSGRGQGAGPGARGPTVLMESGFSPEVMRRLEELGYQPTLISLPGELRMGYAAAVKIERGRVTAAADPRRSGTAGAVQR